MAAEEHNEYLNQIKASLDVVTSQVRQQEIGVALRKEVLENQIAQARGQVEALASAAERQRVGSRPQEIRMAEAELAQAEAILTQRQADFRRVADLSKAGVMPMRLKRNYARRKPIGMPQPNGLRLCAKVRGAKMSRKPRLA